MTDRETGETVAAAVEPGIRFGVFCFAVYNLGVSYGTTFLLALLVGKRGGNEADAGAIIATAMISTMVAVVLSGHLADRLRPTRLVAAAGVLLGLGCAAFATAATVGPAMVAGALVFGAGWGICYTVIPVIVAAVVEPGRRLRYFALMAGASLSGVGSGPLIGRACAAAGLPLETAFSIAAAASALGAAVFFLWGERVARVRKGVAQFAAWRISREAVLRVLRSKAAYSILMVGLGGAVFGSLSSFQTSYAGLRHLDYSLFFAGFMIAAVAARFALAGMVARRDPLVSSAAFAGLMVLSLLMFWLLVDGAPAYLLAAGLFGVGYGLIYPIINGLAANEAPPLYAPQSLLLFSLAYFIGVFGFPAVAGKIIVQRDVSTLLAVALLIAAVNAGIPVARLIARRRSKATAARRSVS